jgi:hypothetical protein
MKCFVTQFGSLFVLLLALGCGSSDDDSDAAAPLAEQQPRALEDQYRAAADRQRAQPKPAKAAKAAARFDVPLATDQSSEFSAVLERLRARLATEAADGAPEITHLASRTGAPDNLLLANLWFTAQLTDDTTAWRYELTLLWKDNHWVAFGGTAQHGVDEGRELEPAFVDRLISN